MTSSSKSTLWRTGKGCSRGVAKTEFYYRVCFSFFRLELTLVVGADLTQWDVIFNYSHRRQKPLQQHRAENIITRTWITPKQPNSLIAHHPQMFWFIAPSVLLIQTAQDWQSGSIILNTISIRTILQTMDNVKSSLWNLSWHHILHARKKPKFSGGVLIFDLAPIIIEGTCQWFS